MLFVHVCVSGRKFPCLSTSSHASVPSCNGDLEFSGVQIHTDYGLSIS